MTIEVIDPGLLSSVQDATGRRYWRHLGVPVGGAADGWSARLANRLVGNPDDLAVLEMTISGPTLVVSVSTTVAVTGGLSASLDGLPIAPNTARHVRAGSRLQVNAGPGARGYLGVAGGIEVEPVLGSRSTDLRTGFGGLDGRAIRARDRLPIGPGPGRPYRWMGATPAGGPIRLLAGPHADGLEALTGGTLRVSDHADRAGVRLSESVARGGEVASLALPLGAVQVPPDGRPIVMLVDRPVTGGYPVPAIVIGADIGRVAQLRPGDGVTFVQTTLAEARAVWRQAENQLAALEPLEEREDDELGWTGSHR